MFVCIIYDNANIPYVYGPFATEGQAQAYALDNSGYRFVVAQFIEV